MLSWKPTRWPACWVRVVTCWMLGPRETKPFLCLQVQTSSRVQGRRSIPCVETRWERCSFPQRSEFKILLSYGYPWTNLALPYNSSCCHEGWFFYHVFAYSSCDSSSFDISSIQKLQIRDQIAQKNVLPCVPHVLIKDLQKSSASLQPLLQPVQAAYLISG